MKCWCSKILCVCILYMFGIISLCAQEEKAESNTPPYLSIEAFGNLPYYLMKNIDDNYYNFSYDFNYGGGLYLAGNLKSFKLLTGAWYSTKKYYSFDPLYVNSTKELRHKLEYLNIPILFNFKFEKNKVLINRFFATTGFIFNFPGTYKVTTIYRNGDQTSNNIGYKKTTGISLRFGLKYERTLSNKVNLFFDMYSDVKIKQEYEKVSPSHFPFSNNSNHNLTNDYIMFGINIGVSFNFKKQGALIRWIQKQEVN